jgi:prepilin-type N-terminal cleavage/methylation domain-containing protein
MAGMRHTTLQFGFTLLELIVVVLVLAIIAGTVLTSFGPDFIEDQEETAALFEMTQIRDAILQFKQDNPSHVLSSVNLCSPADASFLITNNYDTDNVCDTTEQTISPWDPDYRIGWQGPYIQKLGEPSATSIVDIEHDGTIDTETALSNITVITDPYRNPYYFFELDNNGNARIVSFGADGIYDNDTTSPGCPADASILGDDLIVCLR